MDSPAAPTTANPKKNNTNPSSRTSPSGNKNKRSRHQRGKNNNNNNNNKENGKGHKCGSGGRGNPRRKNSSISSSNNNNNHRPMSQEKISRALSWALRHAALNIGLSIREDGFVPVQEILDSTHPKLRGATLENIKLVVNNNDKQRFKLEERPRRLYYESKSKTKTNTSQRDPTDTTTNASAKEETATEPEPEPETILCIRANQGHSMDLINPELLLTKLSPQDLRSLPCIVHGTYPKAWESIHRAPEHGGGLRTMNRTHIHFASGLPAESGVISGMRKSCSVHVYVDASLCAADDRIEFFRSDNGVILTDGVGDSGVLPIEYFSHVTDSSGKILLDNRKNNNPVR
mmetsp:Transcript_3730/g.9020  ORF Transcript_3730/g.9020 Transcript_3730/m.9020 type:complete len:346 (-) Transcript_3730:1624-2661(-)